MQKFLSILAFLVLIFPVRAQENRSEVLQSLEQGQGHQQAITATVKSAARLFGAKDDLTTVIMIIPAGSTVTILGSDSTYYQVNHEDSEGYIFKRQVVIDNKSPSSADKNNNSVNSQVTQTRPVETSKISRFSYLENKYGTSVAARISSGKIWKGMSPDMVKDSWGNPEKISRVINGNVVKEEWIYKSTQLQFQNNTLIYWGPSKE